MAAYTEGLKLISVYQRVYGETTGKALPLNKYALRGHADALVKEFGLELCTAVAEYYIKNSSSPANISGFMYRFGEVQELMDRADKDRLDRMIQRQKLYDAMRAERDVS